MSIQFHSGMGTKICACVFLSLNASSFGVVPNNLASHAHVILPSHIDCISANHINTIKNAVTCTHSLQEHSSKCFVKAEVDSFKYEQCAVLETILIRFQCILGFFLCEIYRMDLNFHGTKLSRIENFCVFRVFIFADARPTILY